MKKEKIEEMLKQREELKQQLELQYQQLIGQIALLKQLLQEFDKENKKDG